MYGVRLDLEQANLVCVVCSELEQYNSRMVHCKRVKFPVLGII